MTDFIPTKYHITVITVSGSRHDFDLRMGDWACDHEKGKKLRIEEQETASTWIFPWRNIACFCLMTQEE